MGARKFKVGDGVRIVKASGHMGSKAPVGMSGRIVCVDVSAYGFIADREFVGGHDTVPNSPRDRGYAQWVDDHYIIHESLAAALASI